MRCYWVQEALWLVSVNNASPLNAKKCSSTQHRLYQRHHMSHVIVIVIPSNAFFSRAAVAKGVCSALLKDCNLWLMQRKPRRTYPGPPGWGWA